MLDPTNRTSFDPEQWDDAELSSHVSSGSLLWPIILSLLVLFIIGRIYYRPGTLTTLAENLNPALLAAAILLLIIRILVGGLRLNFVSHGRLGFRKAIRGQFIWDFSSAITPSLIGGAPLAAPIIAKDSRLRLGKVTSFMLFAMLLDQIWLAGAVIALLIASLQINVYPDSLGLVGSTLFTAFFVAIVAWTVLYGYATLVKPDVLQRIVRMVTSWPYLRHYRTQADAETEVLQARAAVFRSESLPFYVIGLFFTLVIWMCRYCSLVLIVWSVHGALPKLTFLFRTVAMMTGALIMPTPGGAGGIEGMYALFFNSLMPRALVAPTLLFWRIAAYYLFIILGVYISRQIIHASLRSRRQAS